MRTYISLQIAAGLLAVIILSSCSFKVEAGYHGETGRDDRVISEGLYRKGITQERSDSQRY